MLEMISQVIVMAEPGFNSEGLVSWGVKNIIPIILLVVGVAIIAGARKGQMSQNALTITNVMLGCMLIAGGGAHLRVRRLDRDVRLQGLIGMLIRPDDDVYRVDAVWLGPQGFTLPWAARYSAYGIWVILFVGILLVEAALPMRSASRRSGSCVFSILATYARDRRDRPRTPGGQCLGDLARRARLRRGRRAAPRRLGSARARCG